MEERELLVQKARGEVGIRFQRNSRGSKPLKDGLGCHLGDIVEHLPILGLSVELFRPNRQCRRAARGPLAEGDNDAANMLSGLQPPAIAASRIEAEEFRSRVQDQGLGAVCDVDLEDVCAFFLEDEPLIVALQQIATAWEPRDSEAADLAAR